MCVYDVCLCGVCMFIYLYMFVYMYVQHTESIIFACVYVFFFFCADYVAVFFFLFLFLLPVILCLGVGPYENFPVHITVSVPLLFIQMVFRSPVILACKKCSTGFIPCSL